MISFFAKAGVTLVGIAGIIAVVGAVVAGIVMLIKKKTGAQPQQH